jgi:hypothetical protein
VPERFQEQRRAPLALPKAGHQQAGERHQPWPRLAHGHAGGQWRTRRLAAAGTDQAMAAVLADLRPNLGQLPDLVAQRFGVGSCQSLTTMAATGRLEFLDVRALLGRQQGPFVFGMAGLTTPLAPGSVLVPLGLGVRMFAAGRHGRIPQGLVQTGFQLGQARQQGANDGLGLAGLARDQVFRDLQSHAAVVGSVQLRGKPPAEKSATGCERLRRGKSKGEIKGVRKL